MSRGAPELTNRTLAPLLGRLARAAAATPGCWQKEAHPAGPLFAWRVDPEAGEQLAVYPAPWSWADLAEVVEVSLPARRSLGAARNADGGTVIVDIRRLPDTCVVCGEPITPSPLVTDTCYGCLFEAGELVALDGGFMLRVANGRGCGQDCGGAAREDAQA